MKEGIEVLRALEASLGTKETFDLAKVYLGTQTGDFLVFPTEAVDQCLPVFEALKAENAQFDYRRRPEVIPDGVSYLQEHEAEIEEHEARLRALYPDMNVARGGRDIIVYFHRKRIQEAGEDLLDRVLAVREFTTIIDYAPALSVIGDLGTAHEIFGTFFDIPPCCIANYPTTIRSLRNYLAEDLEPYIEFVPCRPDCGDAIAVAELQKLAFETVGLDKAAIEKQARDNFRGFVGFKVDPGAELVADLGAQRQGDIYLVHRDSRAALSEAYAHVSGIEGVAEVVANTIINPS